MTVIGYPTTDRELDMMYESESAKAWEELNSNFSQLEAKDFDSLNNASASLEVVMTDFRSVVKYMSQAIGAINETPESDKLESLLDDFETTFYEVKQIQETIQKEMWRK